MNTDNSQRFEEAKRNYENSVNSVQYRKWYENSKEAYRFYEGDHFTEQEKKILESRGQPIVPVNKIAVNIDNIIGQEVKTRMQPFYQARSMNRDDMVLAEALTEIARFVQDDQETNFKLSQVNKDRLISGLGGFEVDVEGERIVYKNVDNPRELVWDITDPTQKLTDSRFVARHRWMSKEEAKNLFPQHKEEIERYSKTPQSTTTGVLNYDEPFDAFTHYYHQDSNRIKVVEYQYRENCKKYRVYDSNEKVFEVYSEDEAKKYGKKSSSTTEDRMATYEEIDGYCYKYFFFTGDVMLEEGKLPVQVDDFTIMLDVFKRDSDGVPYGILKDAIPLQRELNKRRSKAMHYLNSERVIYDTDAVDDPKHTAKEIARPDGMIAVKKGAMFELLDGPNSQKQQQQLQMMQDAEQKLNEVMGIFPESLGATTNATSGAAIRRRQEGTERNQVKQVDDHQMFRRRFARHLLAAIMAVFNDEMIVPIVDEDGARKTVTLNSVEVKGDHEVRLYNIQAANMSITVDEEKDFRGTPEKVSETIKEIVMNGQAMYLQSEDLLAIIGVPPMQAKRIAQSFKQPASPEMGQGAGPSAAGGQQAAQPSLESMGAMPTEFGGAPAV